MVGADDTVGTLEGITVVDNKKVGLKLGATLVSTVGRLEGAVEGLAGGGIIDGAVVGDDT